MMLITQPHWIWSQMIAKPNICSPVLAASEHYLLQIWHWPPEGKNLLGVKISKIRNSKKHWKFALDIYSNNSPTKLSQSNLVSYEEE